MIPTNPATGKEYPLVPDEKKAEMRKHYGTQDTICTIDGETFYFDGVSN